MEHQPNAGSSTTPILPSASRTDAAGVRVFHFGYWGLAQTRADRHFPPQGVNKPAPTGGRDVASTPPMRQWWHRSPVSSGFARASPQTLHMYVCDSCRPRHRLLDTSRHALPPPLTAAHLEVVFRVMPKILSYPYVVNHTGLWRRRYRRTGHFVPNLGAGRCPTTPSARYSCRRLLRGVRRSRPSFFPFLLDPRQRASPD